MKLTGYNLVNLKLLYTAIGEENLKDKLSSFSCPQNEDVEIFLREKAIEFSKQSIAATHFSYLHIKCKIICR